MKKLGLVAAAVIAAVALLTYTKMGSYAGTAWGKFRTSAGKQVPIEFEIDRLKREVAQLIPDMKKNRSTIAEEMVAVDNLKEEIAGTRRRIEEQKAVLAQLKKDIGSGETLIYGGRTVSKERALEKLSRDLESCKRCEAEIKAKEQLLEAKERALEAAKEQLATMREQKQDLEVQIAQLEADVKTVRLAQTRCKFQLDDTRLAEVKRSLGELRTRLKVEQTAAEMEAEWSNDEIPVHKKLRTQTEVLRDVDDYLSGAPKADGKLAIQK